MDTRESVAHFVLDGGHFVTNIRHAVDLWKIEDSGFVHQRRVEHPDRVSSLAVSPDGGQVVAVGGTESEQWFEVGPLDHRVLWWDLDRRKPKLLKGHDDQVEVAVYAPNGAWFVTGGRDGRAILWNARTGRRAHRLEGHEGPITAAAFSPDGTRLSTGDEQGRVFLWDAPTGEALRSLPGHSDWVSSAAFSPDGRRLVTTSLGGGTRIWDGATGDLIASVVTFLDGAWLVVDPAGRFDTEDIGALDGAAWVRSFDPLRPLLLTTFARSMYRPGLLRALWAGENLPQVPDVLETNALTPTVRILSVEPRVADLQVTVQVCTREEGRATRNGHRTLASGGHDLQLLLDGRLVHQVDVLDGGCTTHRARITPPAGARTVEVSAHAFNVDDVKSETVRIDVVNPRHRVKPQRRVFLVTVGVNRTSDAELATLAWASADARWLADRLTPIPGHAPDPLRVVLADDATSDASPSVANLTAVLGALAGDRPPPGFAPHLRASGPDDLVIVTFSGHGVTNPEGLFELVLSDASMSEIELAEWLRPVIANELVLIVDACQSAASVEGEGFQPGPLGSRGFGQLAYDKGMWVLAGSQSDAVALESAQLAHGVMTFALVNEGLAVRTEVEGGEPELRLGTWLDYAVTRVPEIAAILREGGELAGADPLTCHQANCQSNRGIKRSRTFLESVQRPRLFVYKRSAQELRIR